MIIKVMAISQVFSKLDMFAGYWETQLAEHVKGTTTFTCRYDSFQSQVMPFGLMNAPAMFQRMAKVFANFPYVKVYIDEIIICSDQREAYGTFLHRLQTNSQSDAQVETTKMRLCTLQDPEPRTCGIFRRS